MPDAGLVGRGGDQGPPDAANQGGHDEAAGAGALRIVSLLPSATETLFALGLGNQLVAVTHECDYPPEAALLPIVTRSTLGLEDKDSGGIEAAVSLAAAEGRSLYEVDTAAIRDLHPDLVIAQDVCRVCAVAAACGSDAAPLLAGLHSRLDAATRAAKRKGTVHGVFLEWIDPPYRAGHWTPDLLTLAGIEDPLARAGVPSVALSWADVVAARPELLILAPRRFSS